MQSQFKWFTAIVLFLFIITSHINAQDLQVDVTVDYSQLAVASQEKLLNFKRKVEDYLNKNKYHLEKIPTIKVQMQFNFTAVNPTSLTYDAKLFIASQREVYNPFKTGPEKYSVTFRFLDERCEFVYNENLPFIKNDQRFDSFLSLLDYYAYMIVGYDEDSYYPKGGNKYFQKAIDICNKVTGNVKGWNDTGGGSKPSRLLLVQELLNVRYDNFRNGFFEYMWTGLDSLTIRKVNAQKNILDALETISNVKKKEVKAYNIDIFFDSKSNEIAETFLDFGDRSVYDKLARFDPSHQAIYDEARKRAR